MKGRDSGVSYDVPPLKQMCSENNHAYAFYLHLVLESLAIGIYLPPPSACHPCGGSLSAEACCQSQSAKIQVSVAHYDFEGGESHDYLDQGR
jgi:hypothetical protein